jgi:hypothetical protein
MMIVPKMNSDDYIALSPQILIVCFGSWWCALCMDVFGHCGGVMEGVANKIETSTWCIWLCVA